VKKNIVIIAALAALTLTACGQSSPVGLLDVQRLTANWPQYINVQNQLLADQRAIESGSGSNAQKAKQVAQLQAKYSALSQQLVSQIKNAASKVAQQKNLKLIVTREFIGYGGTDITPDVEKQMGITESSPSPSASP
jgi:Skp family chaperone for outer membrane proteins